MRWLIALAAIAAPLAAADLSSIGPVYLWPMNGALDQYVAGQATSEGLFPVTVDPARAKTFFGITNRKMNHNGHKELP